VFFLWSVVSSVFSYAPDISLDKLRGVSLFLIFYFVYHNLRTLRAARFLAFALIFSTMFAVLWTPVERIIGRGVEIYDFRGSAFEQIGLQEGDAILQINGQKVNSLEAMRQKIFENPHEPQFKALIYRADAYTAVEIPRQRIKQAATPEESLGIKRWTRSRNWRAAGFYGHFTTFAEALQMIISLTFGIFIAAFSTSSRKDAEAQTEKNKSRIKGFLLFCLLGMALALLLTVTRASQLAFLISASVIVLLNGNRKIILTLAALFVPLAIIALVYLQSSRRVGFFDTKDNSITWRQTVYGEGLNLWTSNARNLTVGVGMDSIKRYARDWHLFDDGRLPMGHFHSTPLQLLVERGLPALIIWLTILGIYARTLRRYLRSGEAEKKRKGENPEISASPLFLSSAWIDRGIVLGAFGGLVGFFTSGLVHYNLGDGEVAMVFYILMGLSVFVCHSRFKIGDESLILNLKF